MRFWSRRDYQTAIDINKELINTVVDTVVIIYKMNLIETRTNIYDESTKKKYYVGVRVPCLINREQTSPTLDGNIVSSLQGATFYFLRQECEARNVYIETGDIIEFHDSYYEIVNSNETQLIAGQVVYNHALFCQCVLTRIPAVQLQRPDQ